MSEVSNQDVLKALAEIKEPALNRSLVSAMLLRDIEVKGDTVSLTLALLSPMHPFQAQMEDEIKAALAKLDAVKTVDLKTVVDVPADIRLQTATKSRLKTVIAVASGKGGVGKSTMAVNLAVSLAQAGVQVGLMDADVYGPNIPLMMGVEKLPPVTDRNNIPPAESHGVKLMSIGFMVEPNQPIVWRGPMLHTAIRQFIQDVDWGELDYLVVDLPPGTGDAQLSLAQTISVTGGLIVTLPQQVSLEDARRGLEMFRQLSVPILGVAENMSGSIFGEGGGKKLAEDSGVEFLGNIPMDSAVREGGDAGTPVVISHPNSDAAKALRHVAAEAALRASLLALRNQTNSVPINIIN